MEWLLLRQICSMSVVLDCKPDSGLASQYLRESGKYIKTLSIIPSEYLFPCSSPTDSIIAAGKYCSNLTSFFTAVRVYHPGIAEILRNNPNLRDIKLSHSVCTKSPDISDIVLPDVHTFCVYHHDQHEVDLFTIYKMFPNLLRLCVPSCDPEVPEGLFHALAPHTPQLRTLAIYASYPMENTSLLAYMLQCTHLVHLDLRSTAVTDTGICALAHTLRLQSLAFTHITDITDQSLLSLARFCFATLRVLHIEHQISDDNIDEVCTVSSEAVCELRQKCIWLKFNWYTELLVQFPNSSAMCLATSLCLLTEITDDLLIDISTYCKYLCVLDVRHDEEPTPEYNISALSCVINSCTCLETIWVEEETLSEHLSALAHMYPVLFKTNPCDAQYDAFMFPL